MNKNLLSVLTLILMCVVFVMACSDSDGDSDGELTYIDLSDPDTIIGGYAIEFMEMQSPDGIYSNKCELSSAPENCQTVYLMGGYGVISRDNDSNYVLQTQIQAFNSLMITSYGAEAYQYTQHTPIPVGNITEEGINITNGVIGVKGRNMFFNTDNPASAFYLTYDYSKKIMTINLDVVDKIYTTLDENGNVLSCTTLPLSKAVIKMRKTGDGVFLPDVNSIPVPDASINDNGVILYPYKDFLTEPKDLVCP